MNKLNDNFLTVEDFVWNTNFRQWVLSDDNNELDNYWLNWLANHPEKNDIALTAREVIQAIKVKDVPVSDVEVNQSIKEIMLYADIATAKETNIKHLKFNWYKITGIAASLLLIISITLFFISRPNQNHLAVYSNVIKSSGIRWVEKVNNTSGPVNISMPDGSTIVLEKNAKINFAENFTAQSSRKVYLNGKATFEVTKNPEKPFLVYTNRFVTKVLGTKFTITSNEGDKNPQIEVISGVVAVYPVSDVKAKPGTNNQNSLILTRNQKATYSDLSKTLSASIIEHPLALQEKIFDKPFYDVPLVKIFKRIEENYGIELIYDDKLLTNRTFTADLSKTTLYQKLNIICKVINARYETIDGKIVFYTNTTPNNE